MGGNNVIFSSKKKTTANNAGHYYYVSCFRCRTFKSQKKDRMNYVDANYSDRVRTKPYRGSTLEETSPQKNGTLKKRAKKYHTTTAKPNETNNICPMRITIKEDLLIDRFFITNENCRHNFTHKHHPKLRKGEITRLKCKGGRKGTKLCC